MSGFFSKEEIPMNTQIATPSCAKCGLSVKCRNPKIEPTGKGDKGIYIISDHPSEADDIANLHLDGDSGDYFIKLCKKLKIDVRNDCIIDYSVRCRPPKGEVTKTQIEACRSKVWDNIKKVNPSLIILLGSDPLETFLKPRWESTIGDIDTWRGFIIPDRESKCWVMSTYHPRFVTQNLKKHPVLEKILLGDLKDAFSHLNKEFPRYKDERQCIQILNDEESSIRDCFNFTYYFSF